MGEIAEAIRRAGQEAQRTKIPASDPDQEPAATNRELLWPTPPENTPSVPSLEKPKPQAVEPSSFSREKNESTPARICLLEPGSPPAQTYRRLALRLRALIEERGLRSLVVTSAMPQEGKTTIACNLAVETARLDQSTTVALVEFDLRRPMIGRSFGFAPKIGVESLLLGEASVEDCAIATEISNLDVFTVRTPVSDPDRHFSNDRLSRCLADLEAKYSLVLIDTPPLVVGSDTNFVLRHADAGILVAVAAHTPARKLKRLAEDVPTDKLIACVLNCARPSRDHAEYASYYHHPEPHPMHDPDHADSPERERGGPS